MSNALLPSQFTIGSVYNLTMAVPAYHGTTMDNMRLVSIMDYESALESSPVNATHASVKALAPTSLSLPTSVETSQFFKFKSNTGVTTQPVYLAADWITSAVILSTIMRTIHVQIDSPASEASLKHILAHLSPKVTILSYTNN